MEFLLRTGKVDVFQGKSQNDQSHRSLKEHAMSAIRSVGGDSGATWRANRGSDENETDQNRPRSDCEVL